MRVHSTVFSLVSILLLTGCVTTPVTTTNFSADGKGIPYHLPTAYQKVEVTVQRDDDTVQDLTISVSPVIVPDRSKLFYLNSNDTSSFSISRNITLSNGMLTTLRTEDDGQGGDIALSVLDSIVSVLKISGAGPGVSAQAGTTGAPAASPFAHSEREAQPEEIEAALALISGDEFGFTFFDKLARFDLPGTDGLLYIEANKAYTPSVTISPSGTPDGRFDGIYTRTPTSANIKKELKLDMVKLKERRTAAFTAQSNTLTVSNTTRPARLVAAQGAKDAACEGIDTAIQQDRASMRVAILAFDSDVADETRAIYNDCLEKIEAIDAINAEAQSNQGASNRIQAHLNNLNNMSTADVVLKEVNTVVLVPDEERIVRIPIERAILGETITDIKLNNGMLTSFNTDRPAVAVEVAKSVQDVFKGIVAVPAELIQFKIDTTGKAGELAEKQLELEEKIDQLEGTQRETTEQERLTELTSQQAELAAKQNALQEELDKQSDTAQTVREIDQQVELLKAQARQIDAERQEILNSLNNEKALLESSTAVNEARKANLESEQALLPDPENDPRAEEIANEIATLESMIDLENARARLLEQQILVIGSQNTLEAITNPSVDTDEGVEFPAP